MAGYSGYSMSNNAVNAYEHGEKPLSKWSKKDLLEEYKEKCKDEEIKNYDLSKISLSNLKDLLLSKSSWHHTSSHFNETDFYEISIINCEELSDEKIEKILKKQEEEKQEKKANKANKANKKIEKVEVAFLIWSGSRAHPKANEYKEIVEYDETKNYVQTTFGKKFINANGFYFI